MSDTATTGHRIDEESDVALAITGRKPTRAARITPAFRATETTRQRLLGIVDGGALSAWYGGSYSHAFEDQFATYHGVSHACAVNSGTAALHTAIAAAGVEPGDEVIVPSACFFTAATAVLQQNAIPILADCCADDLGLDPAQLPALVTARTRAILVTHMYGYPARIREVCELAQQRGLIVIEDCGQSVGARIDGRTVGVFGDFGCFSLASPRKHISVGEGGVVIARDPVFAQRVRRLVNKGKDNGWYTQRMMGYSYTMPELTAAVALQGLEELEQEIARRRDVAQCYDEVLADSGLELEVVAPSLRHVYFRKLIRLPNDSVHLRDWMVRAIEAENVSAKPPHLPLHRLSWLVEQRAYARGCPFTCHRANDAPVNYRTAHLPVTDRELDRIIDLETGPGMTQEDAFVSADAVRRIWDFICGHRTRAEEMARACGPYE
jgi:perosamine synthetase